VAYGDACTLSFHATKLFHTVEGGAVVLHTDADERRMHLLRSFGHIGDEHFSLGINAKMSEVHAAMGLAVLPHVPQLVQGRKRVCDRYDAALQGLPVERPVVPAGTDYNYAYYPVLLADEATRERVHAGMARASVFTRRYFFPSLNTLPYVSSPAMPVSDDAAARVLCLPLYPELTDADIDRILAAFTQAL
jgi:dTDP-4-amino-4,6-dideoxygalactose transaminase